MLTKLTRTSHLRPPWRPPAAHVGGPRHHQWSISRCVSLLRRRIHHPVARRADRECICTPKHSWPLMPFFSARRTSRPPPPGQIGTESCPYDGADVHRRCYICRRAGGTHQSHMEYLNGGRIIKFLSIPPSSATHRTPFVGANDRFDMDYGRETQGSKQYGSPGHLDVDHAV